MASQSGSGVTSAQGAFNVARDRPGCAARTEEGLTQAELAEHLGSSQAGVARMEAGDRRLSYDVYRVSLTR